MATNQKDPNPVKEGKTKKKYEIAIYSDWCKRCGICVAFCPKNVLGEDVTGIPFIVDGDACIGCQECEKRCPDFAIEIKIKEQENDTEK